MVRRRRPSPHTRAVLEALAAQGEEWSHGYELGGRLGIPAGTLYPILIRLADRGQVERTWEQDPPRGRPARHLYRLSESGTSHVAELREADAAGPEPAGRARPAAATAQAFRPGPAAAS